jgi:diketogulonate reductase-like aldo/keto reductase
MLGDLTVNRIPGTGDPVHLTENIDAAALRLSPQETSSLAATPLPASPHSSAPPN